MGIRSRANINGNHGGSTWQGLSTGIGVNRRAVLRRACGSPENRTKIHYGNQVGGIGLRMPNVQKFKCACTHPIFGTYQPL